MTRKVCRSSALGLVLLFLISLLVLSHNDVRKAKLFGCTNFWACNNDNLHRKQDWIQELDKYFGKSRNIDQTYGSHVLPLFASVMVTSGSMLEMGCGFFSTPLLDRISKEQRRFMLTAETDLAWMNKFTHMNSTLHRFVHVPVYEGRINASLWNGVGGYQNWGVVFVDHRPGDRRFVDVLRMRHQADILVIHDTETKKYHYEPILETFPHKYTCTFWRVHTTVVSDSNPDKINLIKTITQWSLESIIYSQLNLY